MEQCVPKRRHIKLRRRGITQKKAYSILNVTVTLEESKNKNSYEANTVVINEKQSFFATAGRLRLKCDSTRTEINFVFRRNGRVHLNRRGRQFSRLLAAEVCASAVVMLDTPCSELV